MTENGIILQVSGPVVLAGGVKGAKMYELVRVGSEDLVGEIIALEDDRATVQVYEETSGLTPGEVVHPTGISLSVELGPGLLGRIYDGVQRPLVMIQELAGDYIKRGIDVPPLMRDVKWEFTPIVSAGDQVITGDVIGTVPETKNIVHKILVPPGVSGTATMVAPKGAYHIDETIAEVKSVDKIRALSMLQVWPVRKPRPYRKKLEPEIPLITGQRTIDTFFPIAKGGTAAIPGPFGSGKTVVQQTLAKWVNADIIVYVGCGERGNEMADVLREFPELEDPHTGEPLMNRTILIANTSNMPVAAREASVYTGITIAEYYRDMGYDVALMADSTSRWAEAMREISGRLEEMPGEEGYPAYLASRLAGFYERSGRVVAEGKEETIGSISIIGAVSPPGGDFSEPVTENTLRMVKVFWALDSDLANRRHFPAINWLESYSLYTGEVRDWWHEQVGKDWEKMRNEMMTLLQKESELEEIVQLVGQDALPEKDSLVLLVSEMIRECFLIQNSFHPEDCYCLPKKQYRMAEILVHFYHHAADAVDKGVSAEKIANVPVRSRMVRMGATPDKRLEREYEEIFAETDSQLEALEGKAEVRL